MIRRVDSRKIAKAYRQMQYRIADMRTAEGVTIKKLLEQSGIGRQAWNRVAYGEGGSSILNVMSVLAALGYKLEIVKEADA